MKVKPSVKSFVGRVETVAGFRCVLLPNSDWQDDSLVCVTLKSLPARGKKVSAISAIPQGVLFDLVSKWRSTANDPIFPDENDRDRLEGENEQLLKCAAELASIIGDSSP